MPPVDKTKRIQQNQQKPLQYTSAHWGRSQCVERERALDPAEVQISNRSNSKKSESANFSLERAERRNYELLKSLEISKARLRSRATFSPLEAILQKAIGSYLKETSLVPCSTKKLYGPTYV
ncbi:uncharacterized protein LOC118511002 isoform X1 [Anopheles stephensi]|uniref:uncharacterized protein LOC118511002 isoform X1 n=1 Tax=Anopheles stephensi TaxID=30069 RepID=UPI001658827C|nr:uncharacterized protein LOC118511002 isoform X1 [Anopheles stephensi]